MSRIIIYEILQIYTKKGANVGAHVPKPWILIILTFKYEYSNFQHRTHVDIRRI